MTPEIDPLAASAGDGAAATTTSPLAQMPRLIRARTARDLMGDAPFARTTEASSCANRDAATTPPDTRRTGELLGTPHRGGGVATPVEHAPLGLGSMRRIETGPLQPHQRRRDKAQFGQRRGHLRV